MTTRWFLLLALLGAPLAACAGADNSGSDPSSSSAGESGMPSAESGDDSDTGIPAGRPQIQGGQTGGEAGIRCNPDVALEPIALDAATPLGYSPADIVAGLPAAYDVALSYAEGATTGLELTLAYDGPVAFAAGCNRIELDVTLGFVSSDGAFDETLHGRLFAASPDLATLTIDVPIAALAGDYATSHAASLPEGPLTLTFAFEFASGTVRGSIDASTGANGTGDSQFIANF
jgi:hypothetical protein